MSAPHAETEPDLRDRAASLVEPIAITPGTRIDRYVVLSKLGAGGMGVVLAAYDPQLDRKVALKVLHPSRDHKEREARRLLREAMAMARLTHPNVITVHDVGEHEKLVYISMELVEGGTLEQKLAVRPPWPDVLELFIAAGRGLAAAHAKGLVHRDFKPENVMVGDDGRVRVMDFGLAHDAVTDSGTATPSSNDAPVPIAMKRSMDTHAGRVAGTPGFIAPELHRGEPADARSDQFAFGVALYEGLFGTRPFVGETIFAVAASTMAGQVREISAKSPVPGWVRRIVLRALAVDPNDRFPSMDALLDALAQHDVRRRRRRVAIAVGGVLAVTGAAVGTSLLLAHRAHAQCERAGAAIESSWNDDIRASTREGFLRDAPAFAPVAFDKSAAWIDRWTAAWHDARRDVCEAATIHETLAPVLEARALACLAERRRVLDGVIAQLAGGGEAITHAAVGATSNLPAIAACSDEQALRRLPEDAVSDAITLDVLADAHAALLSDRAREAVELARQAAARAATHGMPEVEVDARMMLANGLVEVGEFAPAVAEYEQAFYLAGKNGDDASAAEAASEAASTAAFDMREIPLAQRWIPLAEMSLERLGEASTPRAGDILFDLARAQLGAGENDRAEALFEQALAIYERELSPGHPRIGVVFVHLGIVATNRGHYEQAEHFDQQAIDLYAQAFGRDHPVAAAAINNMGTNLDARGQHAAALAMYERALAMYANGLGESHPQYAETLMNIAMVHYQTGEMSKAMVEAQRSLVVFERVLGTENSRVATALNNLVNIAASNGDFAAAEGYQRRALEIHEATLPDDHPELAASLTQAGLLVAAQPDADAAALARARSRLERALAILKLRFGDDHPDSAYALHGLGVVLTRQGALDEAIPVLEHALRLRKHDEVGRAETSYALGDALRRAHREPQRARALVQAALDSYSTMDATLFAGQIDDAKKFLAIAD